MSFNSYKSMADVLQEFPINCHMEEILIAIRELFMQGWGQCLAHLL